MNGHCGGCRARAYGMTGDVMAEDPLCTHTPGTFTGSPLLVLRNPAVEYGAATVATIAWDESAAERMKKIPAFVRGMAAFGLEEAGHYGQALDAGLKELPGVASRYGFTITDAKADIEEN